MNWEKEIDEIARRRELALSQGGEEAIAKHHAKGRLTIRERINKLIDDNTFEEIGPIAGAANYDENGILESFDPANFVLGFGKLSGRKIVVGGEDFTMRGGSPSPAGLRKSVYAEEVAIQYKIPLVRLREAASVVRAAKAQICRVQSMRRPDSDLSLKLCLPCPLQPRPLAPLQVYQQDGLSLRIFQLCLKKLRRYSPPGRR